MVPFAIERIENDKSEVLCQVKPAFGKRVASEANIKELQKMMGNVLTKGTAGRIQQYEIPYNLIGKTGTTQNNGDGRFIASSPEIVIGYWEESTISEINSKNYKAINLLNQ